MMKIYGMIILLLLLVSGCASTHFHKTTTTTFPDGRQVVEECVFSAGSLAKKADKASGEFCGLKIKAEGTAGDTDLISAGVQGAVQALEKVAK